MTHRSTIATMLLALPVFATAPAHAERLVTSISRHQVLVNSSFTGTSIVLFGTIEPDTPTARRLHADRDKAGHWPIGVSAAMIPTRRAITRAMTPLPSRPGSS